MTPPVAVVTGAGGGLGLAIAGALARAGHRVHLTDVDERAAQAAAAALGERHWASALDVADAEACRAVAAATVEQGGRLDVWVNNAGLLIVGPSWSHDDAQRRRLFDVNVHGVLNGTAAALDVMLPAGAGHVVNIVSLAGLVAPPGETLYAATKHACLAFSVGTQADLRMAGIRGVHVSAVCPDAIRTPMLYALADRPDAAPSFQGRMLEPVDVAERVVDVVRKPRPIAAVPRRRGVVVRAWAAMPRLGIRMAGPIMARARRRQARWRDAHAEEIETFRAAQARQTNRQ